MDKKFDSGRPSRRARFLKMSLTATALSTMPIRVVHAPEPNRLLAIPRKEGHVVAAHGVVLAG
jgi:hypothetical protein